MRMLVGSAACLLLVMQMHGCSAVAEVAAAGEEQERLVEYNVVADVETSEQLEQLARELDSEMHPPGSAPHSNAKLAHQTMLALPPHFFGFTVSLTPSQLQRAQGKYRFKLAERNVEGHASGFECPDTQGGAAVPWNLRRTVVEGSAMPASFAHNASWGAGVDVYVLDSGVDCDHVELRGRCVQGFSAYGTVRDVHGHGTHVAGTVAGSTYGFAKAANIIAVHVLNSALSGAYSAIARGVVFAVSRMQQTGRRRSVINMSLGGPNSTFLDGVVEAAVKENMTVVVAAGNEKGDACHRSPARVSAAITVGATSVVDRRGDVVAPFSNYGKCVDIFAPGVNVNSSRSQHRFERRHVPGFAGWQVMGGTSMATPLVAGVAAAYISQQVEVPGPQEVRDWLVAQALDGKIGGLGSTSANKLLHVPCQEKAAPVPAGYNAVQQNCFETYVEDTVATGTGDITFPRGKGYGYPTSVNICWRVRCPGGGLALTYNAFRLNSFFTTDFLYVNGTAFANRRGQLPPLGTAVQYGDEVLLRLESDGFDNEQGFSISYQCAGSTLAPATAAPAGPPPSGFTFPFMCRAASENLVDAMGSIVHLDYKKSEAICWRIACNSTVVLEWELFDLELRGAYISIIAEAESGYRTFAVVESFTGISAPTRQFSGPMTVMFRSTKARTAGGFRANYTCGATLPPTPAPLPPAPVAPTPPPATASPLLRTPAPAPVWPSSCTGTNTLLTGRRHGGFELAETQFGRHCWRMECARGEVLTLMWPTFYTFSFRDYMVLHEQNGTEFRNPANQGRVWGDLALPWLSFRNPVVVEAHWTSGNSRLNHLVGRFTCGADALAPTDAPATPAPTAPEYPDVCVEADRVPVVGEAHTQIRHVHSGRPHTLTCWRVACPAGEDAVLRWTGFQTAAPKDRVEVLEEVGAEFRPSSSYPSDPLTGAVAVPASRHAGVVVIYAHFDSDSTDSRFTVNVACEKTNTTVPPTPVPATRASLTPVSTHAPLTLVPSTPAPATAAPPTHVPLTPAPSTRAPPTAAPTNINNNNNNDSNWGNSEISCNTEKGCSGSMLSCSSSRCALYCNAGEACRGAHMECLSSSSCEVHCNQASSCRDMKSTNANLHSVGKSFGIWLSSTAATGRLACQHDDACRNSAIGCGSAGCQFDCNHVESCRDTTFTTTRTSQGVTHRCQNSKACYSSALQYAETSGDVDIVCNATESCKKAVITCPTYGSCVVTCDGQRSCQELEMRCPATLSPGKRCVLKCVAQDACKDIGDKTSVYGAITVECDSQAACSNIRAAPAPSQAPCASYRQKASIPGDALCDTICATLTPLCEASCECADTPAPPPATEAPRTVKTNTTEPPTPVSSTRAPPTTAPFTRAPLTPPATEAPRTVKTNTTEPPTPVSSTRAPPTTAPFTRAPLTPPATEAPRTVNVVKRLFRMLLGMLLSLFLNLRDTFVGLLRNVLGGLASDVKVHWTCPASACANVCPTTAPAKLAAGCQAIVAGSSSRLANALADTSGGSVLEFEVEPGNGASETAINAAIADTIAQEQSNPSPEFRDYQMKSVDVVETEVVEESGGGGGGDDGLSGGDIAAIVICLLIAAAVVAFLVFWCVCRKKGQSGESGEGAAKNEPAEMEDPAAKKGTY